jgi:uracil-DNA glycosylase family 4
VSEFSINCRRCERLAGFLDEVRLKHPDYFARPVPSFGADDAHLLIVGLAPGMHGANATGRPFTGDFAGVLLYQTLYDTGFANQPDATAIDDGLQLHDCRITNAVRCLPPQNKPVGLEVNNCNSYLVDEIGRLRGNGVVLALGSIAHRAVVKALDARQALYPFGHASEYRPDGRGFTFLSSYHCSRYNTQTKRLTADMFRAVFDRARELLG